GTGFAFTVTAVTGTSGPAYSGTIQFKSSDAKATFPAFKTLQTGKIIVTGTFLSAGLQTITVADPSNAAISGTSVSFSVEAAASLPPGLSFNIPGNAIVGTPFNFSVIATGSEALAYSGTVNLTSSDLSALLPGAV